MKLSDLIERLIALAGALDQDIEVKIQLPMFFDAAADNDSVVMGIKSPYIALDSDCVILPVEAKD